MCDTLAALPCATASGATLFGKNSDRQRGEAHVVELRGAETFAAGERLRCTYIDIPQVTKTHEVLLCGPFWTWGVEMGANVHGVAIGNEAVYARQPPNPFPALTGLDLVRLGLERAVSAAEALEVITTLLETHGQGGDCGHLSPTWYDNSFLIVDPQEGFVLETVGRDWMARRVAEIQTISNAYTITVPDRMSNGMVALPAVGEKSATLDYAAKLADPHRQHLGTATERRARAAGLLQARSGSLNVKDMMAVLRDHDDEPGWSPRTAKRSTICMHAAEHDRGGQTTGALVSELRLRDSAHWMTGTAAPCLSLFKPILFGTPSPVPPPRPSDHYDPTSLWWQHERFHRAALRQDFLAIRENIRAEQCDAEARFVARIDAVRNGGSDADRRQTVQECWDEAAVIEARWWADVGSAPRSGAADLYDDAWGKFDRIAGLHA